MASASAVIPAHIHGARPRILLRRLPQAAAVTIGLATVLNVALFLAASAAALVTPALVAQTPGGPEPLTVVHVAMSTVMQMLAGTLVLAGIVRFRPHDAGRLWPAVAGAALVLSFAMPLTGLPGASLGAILTIEALHVVAGALAILLLPRLAREP